MCLGSALTSSKPGYFPGCPGFFYVSKRGSRSLPHHHQQKANEPDNDEQDIACRIYSGSIHKRLLSVSPPRREASSPTIVSQRSASRPPRQPSHGNNAMRARNGQALRQMGICVRICTQISPTPSLTWAYSDTGAHWHPMDAHLHAIIFITPSDLGIFRCVHISTQQVHIRTHFSPFGSQIERPGHTLFSAIACISARNGV